MKAKSTWFPGIADTQLALLLTERAKQKFSADGSSNPDFFFVRPSRPINLAWPDGQCGPGFVEQMDMAVKAFLPECPSAADLAAIQAALPGYLSKLGLPANQVDVRPKCQGTPPALFIGIWSGTVQPGSCDDQARQNALNAFGDPSQDPLQDITADGTFGLYLSETLVTTLAQQAFQNMPKDLDEAGNPNPFGPLHLTALQVVFPSAGQPSTNSLETYVNGYDDQTWPSIHFTVTFNDTLSVNFDADPSCGERQCATVTHTNYSKNVDILSDIVLALLTIAFPVLLAKLLALAFDIPGGPNQNGGVGCALYDALPNDIPLPLRRPVLEARVAGSAATGVLPHKQKIHLCYLNPRFDYRGFFVSANQKLEDRTPAAQIDGPDSLVIDAKAGSVSALYNAAAADFFGNLSYAWSGGAAASPNAAATLVTFSRGQHKPGDTFQETIRVHVTDVEGSSVTASLTVSIYLSPVSISPLCKAKPWLPQCQNA